MALVSIRILRKTTATVVEMATLLLNMEVSATAFDRGAGDGVRVSEVGRYYMLEDLPPTVYPRVDPLPVGREVEL